MLHLLVLTHTPERCPIGNDGVRTTLEGTMERRAAVLEELGITVKGEWVDPPAHTIWMLADAPNAHIFTKMAHTLGNNEWQHMEVHPVVDMEEALKLLED